MEMSPNDDKREGSLVFEWVGNGKDGDDGLRYYSSCSVNGQVYRVDDDVCIKGEKGKLFLCKVITLFENQAIEESNRAEVCWYFQFNELPRKCRTSLKKSFVHKKELFKAVCDKEDPYYASTFEEVDAETIESLAIIQQIGENEKLPVTFKSNEYFMRYGFNGSGLLSCFKKEGKMKTVAKETLVKNSAKIKQVQKEQYKRNKIPADKSKRKASRAIPEAGKDIIASKKNKVDFRKEGIVTSRTKAFNSEEALGQLLNDSADEVIEISSEEENPLEDEKECSKFVKNSSKSINEVIVKKKGISINNHMEGQIPNNQRKPRDIGPQSPGGHTLQRRTPTRKTSLDVLVSLSKSQIGSNDEDRKTKASETRYFNQAEEEDDDYIPSGSEAASLITESGSLSEDGLSEDDNNNIDGLGFPKTKTQSAKTKTTLNSKRSRSSEEAVLKTPVRTPRRSVCKKVMMPSISGRSMPCATPKTPLEQARQRLHVSSVPDSLPCREEEFAEIYSFIEGKLSSDLGGCMYISGVPGTGKTATVHEVIHVLENERNEGFLPSFHFIELNGMKLTEPNQAYSVLLKALTGLKASPEHASNVLEKTFNDKGKNRNHVILLVDELDLLWTRKQNVMYNLFEWPTRRHAKLIVVAVANTMDLPERVMMNRISSRLGLTRMTFQPYTFRQLQEIVHSRIKGIEAFEEDAMQLIARKVAALSGDARRCLDICRRAVEIAESQAALGSPRKRTKGIVGMRHVNEALQEMFSSPKIIALKSLSKFQAYFMRSVVSEFRRSGLEEALFKDIFDQFQDLCRIEGATPPNASQAFQISSMLGSCKLLLTEPGYNDMNQKIRLNVSQDDVQFAMKESHQTTMS